MKLLLLALLLSTSAFGQIAYHQIEYHGTVGSMTADLASYTARQPDIPGMGKIENYLGVSFSSTDPVPQFFRLSVELVFEDGTRYANPEMIIRRAGKDPTVVILRLGFKTPVKLLLFNVLSLQSAEGDSFVQPPLDGSEPI